MRQKDRARILGSDVFDDDVLVSPAVARAMSGGISDATQRRLIAAGQYPKPIAISPFLRNGRPARVAFVKREIVAWCRALTAKYRGTGPKTA